MKALLNFSRFGSFTHEFHLLSMVLLTGTLVCLAPTANAGDDKKPAPASKEQKAPAPPPAPAVSAPLPAAPAENNQENGGGADKVTICHKGHTITVSRNALQAHLAHGDTIGSCEITPTKR
jgi:hypothetical protein